MSTGPAHCCEAVLHPARGDVVTTIISRYLHYLHHLHHLNHLHYLHHDCIVQLDRVHGALSLSVCLHRDHLVPRPLPGSWISTIYIISTISTLSTSPATSTKPTCSSPASSPCSPSEFSSPASPHCRMMRPNVGKNTKISQSRSRPFHIEDTIKTLLNTQTQSRHGVGTPTQVSNGKGCPSLVTFIM